MIAYTYGRAKDLSFVAMVNANVPSVNGVNYLLQGFLIQPAADLLHPAVTGLCLKAKIDGATTISAGISALPSVWQWQHFLTFILGDMNGDGLNGNGFMF